MIIKNCTGDIINPFVTNVPILYLLKTTENLGFSGIFRGHNMGTLTEDGLIVFHHNNHKKKLFGYLNL